MLGARSSECRSETPILSCRSDEARVHGSRRKSAADMNSNGRAREVGVENSSDGAVAARESCLGFVQAVRMIWQRVVDASMRYGGIESVHQ